MLIILKESSPEPLIRLFWDFTYICTPSSTKPKSYCKPPSLVTGPKLGPCTKDFDRIVYCKQEYFHIIPP